MIGALYTSSVQNNGNIKIILSGKSHPLFEAHFPNYPLLPGFALIDIIAEIMVDEIMSIRKSKFIRNIFPDDVLECEVTVSDKKRVVKVFRDKEKVSEVVYDAK